jgi:murein DD-endopeptidase MepM/ murein hydrolase activator NlpD
VAASAISTARTDCLGSMTRMAWLQGAAEHARALAVHTGQTVRAGEVVGWVGSTGNSTGDHLHFQVHVHAPPINNATTVDPVAYLRGVGVDL